MEGGKGTKKGASKNPWALFVKKMGGVKNAVANKSQYKPVQKKKAPAKPKGKRGRPKKTKGGSFVY